MKLIVKRLVIITSLLGILGIISVTSDTSLWLQTVSDDALQAAITELTDRQEQITDIIHQSLERDPEEDYNKLFNNAVRHTFVIEFTSEEFDGLLSDMIEYNQEFGSYKSNNYRNVTVTYITEDEVIQIDNVGFRSKGNIYSRRLPVDDLGNVREIHFMLKFNEVFDLSETSSTYNSLKKREFAGIEQLLFKWNNQYDPSYMNEVFAYQMFQDVGVVVPNASFAEVQIVIDGKVELVSFYNIFEHYDEEFIRRHFNDDGVDEVGDLYKGSWSATLDPIEGDWQYGVRDWETNYRPIYSKETNKDSNDYNNLIDFSYGLNIDNLTLRQDFLTHNFDIDGFLRAMAMNVLLGNPDDYRGNGNNFYYYFDQDNYLTYIPFDYDNSMGNGWDGQPAFIDYTLGNDIYTWGHFDWNYFNIPLWEKLMDYEEYRIQYENYLEEFIVDGIYSEVQYKSMYNTIHNLYGETFPMYYDKEYFITTKIEVVLEQIDYYRSLREQEQS